MAEKVLLHTLTSGVVLDRGLFVQQSSDAMAEIISNISKIGKPLMVVDDTVSFFTPDMLISMIHEKDGRYKLVNEKINFFTGAQIAALLGGNAGGEPPAQQLGGYQQHAQEDGGVVVKAGPAVIAPVGYNYFPVPEGWSIGKNCSLGPTKIKRKIKNSQGDGTEFYMPPAAFQALWELASKVWSGVPGVKPSGVFATGTGNRTMTIHPDRITNGFNTIRRYEIEQIAKYRGWALPLAA